MTLQRVGLRQLRARVLAVILLTATLFPKAGSAQDGSGIRGGDLDGFLSEFRVGAQLHDVGLLGSQREDGVGANLELLMVPPPFLGFRLWRHHSISFMLDHNSNSGICDDNDGFDTLGIRYGYRF